MVLLAVTVLLSCLQGCIKVSKENGQTTVRPGSVEIHQDTDQGGKGETQ